MTQDIYKIEPTSEQIKAISPYNQVVASQQFDKEFLEEFFKRVDFMKQNQYNVMDRLKGKIVTLLFYEPSTRTFDSFNTAALRLGAQTKAILDPQKFSSASKGETLKDSLLIYQNNCDFLIMRHNEDYASYEAANIMNKPFINAGSGKWQHPTQALLDLYTIKEKLKKLNNFTITVAGDLKRGRTVESLVYLMSHYENNKFIFVAPNNSKIKPSILEYLKEKGIEFKETDDLNKVLAKTDILYMTRIQKERFDNKEEYIAAKGKTIITGENIKLMPKNSILMHPLPRIDEIEHCVDNDPRAIYFDQANNGLFVRMALLDMINEKTYN